MLVSIYAYKATVLGNIHLFRVALGQLGIAAADTILEHIAHGHEFDGHHFSLDGVADGTGSAAAAADQSKLNGVGLGSMDARNPRSQSGHSCYSGHCV